MPSRNNNTTVREEDEVDFNQQDPVNIIYTIGIYGWRKRCVYLIILLTMVLAIINLALTIWILTVMDFSWGGMMGKLRITDEGLILDGHAEFTKTLSAHTVRSRKDTSLYLQSDESVTVTARDMDKVVTGQIYVGNDSVIAKNEKFIIRDLQGKEIFYADTNGVKFARNNDGLQCTVRAELDDSRSFQTKLVKSPPRRDLKLESPTRSLFLNAPENMSITAIAGSMKMNSLNDITLKTKNGKIVLDAKKINLKQIKTSSPTTGVSPSAGVLDVCLCPDGSVFLAPVDKDKPCAVSGNICS